MAADDEAGVAQEAVRLEKRKRLGEGTQMWRPRVDRAISRGSAERASALDALLRSWIRLRRNRRDLGLPRDRLFRGREDVASQFHGGLAAWATDLQRRGVLAIGPDLPSLVEQAPDRGRRRRQPRSGARDRGHLVLLFPVVHRRRLPSGSARPLQPPAPRRRARSRLPLLPRLGRDFCRSRTFRRPRPA